MHVISLFAALCTFDESAQADASKWYLTGGLYQETVDFELTFAGGNRDTLEFEDDLAFRFGVGKPISEDWNIEFEFGFGESDWDGTLIFIDGSTERARLEYEYFQAAALMCYQMNVSDTFKVVPKAGVGFTNAEFTSILDSLGSDSESETEMTFKFGIHAEFALSDTTELFAGYRQEFTDFEDDTEATSTGLIFGARISF